MKRILIIHTGGTFGMVPKKPSKTLAPNKVEKQVSRYVPEISAIAHVDFEVAFNLDSSDIHIPHWQKLAAIVFDNLEKYDGFVIIHGTDSMSYTAAALSFMLPGLSKPVIITGSQRPLAEIRTDARMNLINAVEMATMDIPEVCIYFGTRLFRGNRCIKISSTNYGAFDSPNYPVLAKVGVDITVFEDLLLPGGTTRLVPEMSNSVISLRFFPGLTSEFIDHIGSLPARAIVLEALGMGNVAIADNSLVACVERLCNAGKIVVVTSQTRHGLVDLARYENGKQISGAGAIGCGDMTTEATVVKLMHLLGRQDLTRETIGRLLCEPIAGEVNGQRVDLTNSGVL